MSHTSFLEKVDIWEASEEEDEKSVEISWKTREEILLSKMEIWSWNILIVSNCQVLSWTSFLEKIEIWEASEEEGCKSQLKLKEPREDWILS